MKFIKKFWKLCVKVMKLIRYRFPSKLPTGMTEHETFAASIIETYNFPDNLSYKHTIASMILHLDPLVVRKSKSYFAHAIRKSMANQIAYAKIQEIKALEEKETASTTESSPSAAA